MESKFNWKNHFKQHFNLKGLKEEFVFLFYIAITIVFVLYNQTPKQTQSVQHLIDEENWLIIGLILTGIVVLAALFQTVLKITWLLLKILFALIIKKISK